jgi:hypothetical protein
MLSRGEEYSELENACWLGLNKGPNSNLLQATAYYEVRSKVSACEE